MAKIPKPDTLPPILPPIYVTEISHPLSKIQTTGLSIHPGSLHPLGATALEAGSVNFNVVSEFAEAVTLCLFTDGERPLRETDQIPLVRGERDTWSIRVDGIPAGSTYGYRVDGPWEPVEGHLFRPEKLLLDPFAKHIPNPSRYVSSMCSMREDKSPINCR